MCCGLDMVLAPRASYAGVLVSDVAVWRGDGPVLKCQAGAKGQRNSQLVDPVEQEGGIVAYSCTRR